METKWNGQTIETLLVGNYLNTLCISLKEKELLKEMGKWEKAICDRFTFLCLSWIKVLSDFTAMDERNEASVMLAKEIFEQDITFPVLEERREKTSTYPLLNEVNAQEVAAVFFVYLEQDAENRYQEFLLKLQKEHRTLQQNFTRVAMEWLQKVGKENPNLSWIRELPFCLPCI